MDIWTFVASCIPSAVVLIVWFLDRHAKRKDRKSSRNDEHEERIARLEKMVIQLGESSNDLTTVQKMTVDGLGYIVDGLESNGILNGTGKKYLQDINEFYTKKGLEALQFHALSPKKHKKEITA